MIWLTISSLIFSSAFAIIGDNSIIEKPVVQCNEDSITFTIRTTSPFRGSIYAQDQHETETCRHVFHANEIGQATFEVRIGECGMRRKRQLEPYGVTYSMVLVTTFHPQFMTKFDRVFNVKCFYEHADKMVNANMDVRGIPPETLEESIKILPACQYTIRENSVDGQTVRDVQIGANLVHRWECNNPRFAMLVKNCFVTDGASVRIKVIDERGCPLALGVASNPLIYDHSLTLAYTTIEAFNFPDRNKVSFQCQISVCDQKPPVCPRPSIGDYRPNSITNAGINPTQVVATFQGAVRSNNIGDTHFIDGTITPTTINDNRLPLGRMDNMHSWQREQNSIDYEETNEIKEPTLQFAQRRNRNVTMVPQTESTSMHFQPPSTLNEAVTEPSKPLEVFVKSSSPMPTTQTMEKQRDSRQRRLADEVMDVESDTIYVRSASDMSPNYAGASTLNNASTLTCLDQTAVVSIAVLFSVATLLSLLFITYLCRDMFKICGRDQEKLSVNTVSSNASDSGNTTTPIYIRRLGNPNYVLPF
ncbi:unnamed protein product [Auanema sp. JU1783]|nr:unnamed protein product [Auanema sp. JU1783]